MMTVESSPATLTSWDKVQLARHRHRPHTQDYIQRLCHDFFELRGDRRWSDDQAIVGGVGRTDQGSVVIIGHQKGHTTRESLQHNFGMPFPEGYEKSLRLLRHAEKFGLPVLCFIDTPGAQPTVEAEERGQAHAIARNLLAMAQLKVPIVATVIGEGGSGGALALGLADRLLMLEHAVYTVASPEASAAILWRDSSKAPQAAEAMKITAQDLHAMGIIDEIVPEPRGGAHQDPEGTVGATLEAVLRHLAELRAESPQRLLRDRYQKYRTIGCFYEGARDTLARNDVLSLEVQVLAPLSSPVGG